jgi:hypothetical protein
MITSAKTARKQIPAIYKLVLKEFGWEEGSVNFDIGGGPWDLFSDKLWETHMIENLLYDPYNRDKSHNDFVKMQICRLRDLDAIHTVTIANVLNVIKSREDRKNVLSLAKVAFPQRVYITVYEGSEKYEAQETRDGWQEYRKLPTYLDEVREFFPDAYIKGKLLIAPNPLP